jgi:uncharacterized repeat protein (TIGR04076 family)
MPYRVTFTVKEAKGEHPCQIYKVGDKITFEGSEIVKDKTDGLCVYALASMIPYVTALVRDTPKGDWINHKTIIQCPDPLPPIRTVVFQIDREPV